MSESPGSLSGFWSELKRRKVIKAAAMYAATTFIIIEASDIILPRLGLPDWTVTFLIILLIAGFPITLIFSWIFDVTPQGVQKTESVDEVVTQPEVSEKKKRKLKINDVVIILLLVAVCILAYPKLFSNDAFEDLRDEKGRISVAVMPFENLTGDSLFNTWQGGLQNLMISELSNSSELHVRQYMTMSTILGQKKNISQASLTLSQAKEIAVNLETRTFVLGKILKAGEKIRINAQLLNSETEDIYKTYQVDGSAESDLFAMSDSLAGLIRNYLEIKKLAEGYDSPEVTQSAITQSAEAFQYYIRSYETFEKLDIPSTIGWLMKAIETDPDFIDAYIFLSFTYASILEFKQSEIWLNRGYEKREQAPLRGQLYLDHLHAYHYETPYEEIRYCRQLLEIDEMNTTYWLLLGDAFNKLEQYEEAVASFEKALEIHEKWGTHMRIPHLYYWMGDALHELGNHERENEIYELGLNTFPNDGILKRFQASCAISRGKTDLAEIYINKYRSIRTAEGWEEARILSAIGSSYYFAGKIDEAENYCRQGLALDPETPNRIYALARVLIGFDIDLEEGMELAERAVKLEPDYYGILHTYGLGLYKQGEYEKALETLNKAWEARGIFDPDLKRDIEAVEKALEQK
ncbi:MAG: tetratricopeptide repeat protein [Bacteroidota bacterium]